MCIYLFIQDNNIVSKIIYRYNNKIMMKRESVYIFFYTG